MLDHTALCTTFLILLFANGLMSYDLHHKRQTSEMNEDQFLQENEDMTKAEENPSSNFFEGDILTTPEQMRTLNRLLIHHTHDTTESVDKPAYVRGLIKDLDRTWTDGIVYYKISDGLAPDRQQIVKDAMEHWKQRTCLKFKERTQEEHYVNFIDEPGCASYVGLIKKGGQKLTVGPSCKLGNIIHEIGHAIGFYHEMARPDRDKYVKVKWENIMENRRRNFYKYSSNVIDSRNIPYDYNSIMHYSKLHFAKDRNKKDGETILPTKDAQAHIGQREGLSVLDVKQAKLLYKCGNGLVDGMGQRQESMSPDGGMNENENMDTSMDGED